MLIKEHVIRFDEMADDRDDVILVKKTEAREMKPVPALGSDGLWERFCGMFRKKKVVE
jgi:hypothetical protein